MREVVGEFVIDGVGRGIAQGVLKDDAGDAGVFVVEGDEWIPTDEREVERNGGITEPDFAKRILPAEIAFFESWETFEPAAAKALALQALVEDFECGEWSFNELGNGRSAFDVQNGEGSFGRIGRKACGEGGGFGTGADGEVLQATVTVETNRTCAQSADGHGHLRCLVAAERALRTGLEEFIGRELT